MELKQFLEKISEDTPTPGGGSASALAGALSASLISMVSGLSMSRGSINEKRLRKIRRESLVIQKRLYKAIDEDAESFNNVIKAFRLPKNSEKDRLYRNSEIQKAYKKAILPPMLVCEKSVQLLNDSKILILRGNPNAKSDAGVSAYLADAAIKGGLLNIIENLESIKEKRFLKRMRLFVKRLERKRDLLMGEILEALSKVDKG